MKRELTDRQIELSIAIREAMNMPENGESWAAMTDFVRAVAILLNGAENLVHPGEEEKAFRSAWRIYALKLYAGERNRILRDCLGNKLDWVLSHPNGETIIRKIMSRIAEIHDLKPGLDVADVEIDDILYQERGESDSPLI